MTVFIFTDKVQKLLLAAKGDLYLEVFLILIGLTALLYACIKRPHNKSRYFGIGSLLLILYGSWFISEFKHYKYLENEYSKLTTIYNNRGYKVVEGYVEVLHEEPEGGHDTGDVIRVNDVEFELSCFHNTFGYNRTIVFGGVLTEGAFASIYYYQPNGLSGRDMVIMRIDMLEKVTNLIQLDPLLPCAGY